VKNSRTSFDSSLSFRA